MTEMPRLPDSSGPSPTKASDNFLTELRHRLTDRLPPEAYVATLLAEGAGIALNLDRGEIGNAIFLGILAAWTGFGVVGKMRGNK